jgi:hypothetical protein
LFYTDTGTNCQNEKNNCHPVIGNAISNLFSGMTALVDIYGYVWYIRAVLTGAFVAYLPFSRL